MFSRSMVAAGAALSMFAAPALADVHVNFTGTFTEVLEENTWGDEIRNDQSFSGIPVNWSLDMSLAEHGRFLDGDPEMRWLATDWTLTIGSEVFTDELHGGGYIPGGIKPSDGVSRIEIIFTGGDWAPSVPGLETMYLGVFTNPLPGDYLSNDPAAYMAGWDFEGIAATFDIYNMQNGGVSAARWRTVTLTSASIDGEFLGEDPNAGVPEPGSWALMILGFGLAGGAIRRQSRSIGRMVVKS